MYCMFVVILLCNDIRSCKFYQFGSDGSIFRCTEEEFEKRTVGFKVSWFSDKNNLSAYRHIVQSHNRVKWASVFLADSRVCLNADMLFLSFWRPEVRSETKFKHFILPFLSHVGGTRSRACVVLFAPSWNLTCLTPCVCMCVSNFSPLKDATCGPKDEPWLAMWVCLDSVFRAAYRHLFSAGLSPPCGVSDVRREWGDGGGVGEAVWKAVSFGARPATRTSAYQWVGLRRHGSSRRRHSFGRPDPPSLHGPISKSCS